MMSNSMPEPVVNLNPRSPVWDPRKLSFRISMKTQMELGNTNLDVSELNRLVLRHRLDVLQNYPLEDIPEMGVSIDPNLFRYERMGIIGMELEEIGEQLYDELPEIERREVREGISYCTIYRMLWGMNYALEMDNFGWFESLNTALKNSDFEFSEGSRERLTQVVGKMEDKCSFYKAFSVLEGDGAFGEADGETLYSVRRRAVRRYMEGSRKRTDLAERFLTLRYSIREATSHYGVRARLPATLRPGRGE